MRAWQVALAVMPMILARTAMAAPGDQLEVIGNDVNVRQGPETTSSVIRQVNRGERVIELGRRGNWFEIELDNSRPIKGWIHGSLLNPIPFQSTLKVKPAPRTPLHIRPPRNDFRPARQIDKSSRDLAIAGPKPIKGAYPLKPVRGRSKAKRELVLAATGPSAPIDAETVESFQQTINYLNDRARTVAGIELFDNIEPVGGGVVQVRTTGSWSAVPITGQVSYLNTLLDRWSSARAGGGPAGVMLVDAGGKVLMHKVKP